MFVGGALIADDAPKNAIVKGLTLPTPACMMPQECLGALRMDTKRNLGKTL